MGTLVVVSVTLIHASMFFSQVHLPRGYAGTGVIYYWMARVPRVECRILEIGSGGLVGPDRSVLLSWSPEWIFI